VIIVIKDGVAIDAQPVTFNDEKALREKLLLKIDAILSGISEDESIVAWAEEFPIGKGEIDVLAIGDTGGIYLIETKLSENPSKREIIAQVLDYSSGLWGNFKDNKDKFLEEFEKKKKKGEIPKEAVFMRNLESNLREANFSIVLAMDNFDKQNESFRNLFDFLNRFTTDNLEFLVLELEHYTANGLEILVPKIHRYEKIGSVSVQKQIWPLEKIREQLEKIENLKLKERVSLMLDFAVKNNMFYRLTKRIYPGFGIAYKGKLILAVDNIHSGDIRPYLGQDRFPSDDIRRRFIEGLKELDVLQEQEQDHPLSRNYLQQITDEKFEKLLKFLEMFKAED